MIVYVMYYSIFTQDFSRRAVCWLGETAICGVFLGVVAWGLFQGWLGIVGSV